MPSKNDLYGGPRREQHGPITVKTWPAKVLKAPQPLPGQTSKKSPKK
jgi:hypothetical protein